MAFRGLPRASIGRRYSQRRRRDAAYSCLSAILLLTRTFLEVPRLRPNLIRELDPPRVVFTSQTQRYQTVHNSFSRLNRLFYPLSHRFSPSSFSFAKNSSVIELMGNTLGLSRVRATKIRGERVWWATAERVNATSWLVNDDPLIRRKHHPSP